MVRDKASDVERSLRELRNREYWERKRRIHRILATLLLLAFFVILAFMLWLPAAKAADRDDQILALLLARTCVAEIGFKGTVEECQLMWSINQRNAVIKQRSLARQTLKFNAYWSSPLRQKKFPWIKHLTDANQPKAWIKTTKWSVCVTKWLAFREAALAFVQEPEAFELLCLEAVDYGSFSDTPNSTILEEIQCLAGATLQRYWRIKPWKVNYKKAS